MSETYPKIELLPCPFCGGDAMLTSYKDESLWTHDQVDWFRVDCCECDLESPPVCMGMQEAIDYWQKRIETTEGSADK